MDDDPILTDLGRISPANHFRSYQLAKEFGRRSLISLVSVFPLDFGELELDAAYRNGFGLWQVIIGAGLASPLMRPNLFCGVPLIRFSRRGSAPRTLVTGDSYFVSASSWIGDDPAAASAVFARLGGSGEYPVLVRP